MYLKGPYNTIQLISFHFMIAIDNNKCNNNFLSLRVPVIHNHVQHKETILLERIYDERNMPLICGEVSAEKFFLPLDRYKNP